MHLTHTTLFDSPLLNIRHAAACPPDSAVAYGLADVVVLPIAGVFAKHDAPGTHVIANANHALFFGCGKPYRISFPGGVGDQSLVLKFSVEALAGLLSESAGVDELWSPRLERHSLLSPSALLARDLLGRCLMQGAAMPLAIEELGVSVFAAAVRAACKDRPAGPPARAAALRRLHQAEAVKEAISLDPGREWTLDALAQVANASPFHLARLFRAQVGIPVYQYLLRTRLARAMEMMRDTKADLSAIALEAGFSSHSHFSASFRALFGVTPSRLRSGMCKRAGF